MKAVCFIDKGVVDVMDMPVPELKYPDDILVKVLHCEKEAHIPVATDMFPYYKWSDVRAYFQDILNK